MIVNQDLIPSLLIFANINKEFTPWPTTFDQERRCAVVTLRSIVFGGEPVLLVFHDEDDHGWQFLDGRAFEMSNAALVALEEIVQRDPSMLEIADVPPGWKAWRDSAASPWQRAPADGTQPVP